MKEYNHKEIEKKWQKIWEQKQPFCAESNSKKPKFYALVEFPYPSAQGLHVGHPRPYTALDIVSRKRRLQGYNVLFPIGWDAFGLPTENFAIKNKIHPAKVTEMNVKRFKSQCQSLGLSFDWSREINTTDPSYFKWTQWIFQKMFEHGLAYKKEMPINWCPSCKIGLANEEVIQGNCERCGSEVTHRVKNQWMLKITAYAERLIEDLKDVDYIERVKTQQINWIGKSIGMEIKFPIAETKDFLKVFTTRPDTIFGSTYMVIAPEHPLIEAYRDKIQNYSEIVDYRESAQKKSDLMRTDLAKDKTGLPLKGLTAINPGTKQEIPIWVSDYVMMTYGTGAIMAVPGHDQRDWEFATKFGLPIIEVVSGGDISKEAYTVTDSGEMVNSDFLNGLSPQKAFDLILEKFEAENIGEKKVNYKLRDWVFSRQRYWGEPIPLIYCSDCGWLPVPEEQLPVTLPEIESYEPTDTGESPLSAIKDWVSTTCPKCGKDARRETDTMPQWAGSSWYYLRYTDPDNDSALASKDALNYWTPVDWYNGGMEHTTLHLLYSRFWHKFLYDIGVVPTKEPYAKRTSHGMILGEGGEKMSKSRGNVVNPDDYVEKYGADTLRTYEMFIGDFEKAAPWSEAGARGCRRFLEKVWKLQSILVDGDQYSKDMESAMHKTIKKVDYDYEHLKFNTAIAALMTLVNQFQEKGNICKAEFQTVLLLLNPVAPHLTEELWEVSGGEGYIHEANWPVFDEKKTLDDVIELPIQINGKTRGTINIPAGMPQEEILENLKASSDLNHWLEGKTIVKQIYVEGKIFNLILR